MQHSQQLNEGLRSNDLKDMVHSVLTIDTHRSKMGEDRDVCVLSFKVNDRNPAKDLMEFIEKGYNFVLDADVSAGENEDGEYFVFVELSRTPRLAEQIKELEYGVRKLTDIEDWKFKQFIGLSPVVSVCRKGQPLAEAPTKFNCSLFAAN